MAGGFGGVDGCLRRAAIFRDSEITSLFPQPAGVVLVVDVPLDAVSAIKADGVVNSVRRLDLEAVAVGPFGGDEFAAAKCDQRFRREADGGEECRADEGEKRGVDCG